MNFMLCLSVWSVLFFVFSFWKWLENKVTVYNITKMNNDYINEPPCADIFILSLVKFWKFKIDKSKEKTTSIYMCGIVCVYFEKTVFICKNVNNTRCAIKWSNFIRYWMTKIRKKREILHTWYVPGCHPKMFTSSKNQPMEINHKLHPHELSENGNVYVYIWNLI